MFRLHFQVRWAPDLWFSSKGATFGLAWYSFRPATALLPPVQLLDPHRLCLLGCREPAAVRPDNIVDSSRCPRTTAQRTPFDDVQDKAVSLLAVPFKAWRESLYIQAPPSPLGLILVQTFSASAPDCTTPPSTAFPARPPLVIQ